MNSYRPPRIADWARPKRVPVYFWHQMHLLVRATCDGWPSPITPQMMRQDLQHERYYAAIYFCAAVAWLVADERWYTEPHGRSTLRIP